MIDEKFQPVSLLLVDLNVITTTQFKDKFPEKTYSCVVNPSGQKFGHFTYKFSTS